MASNSDIIKIGFDYKDNLEKFLKDYDGTMDQVQKSADGKRIEIQFDVTDKNVMKKISSLQGEFKNVKIELDGKPLERQLDSIEDIKKVLTNVVDMVNKGMSFDSLFNTKSLTKELEIFSKIEDHLSSLRSVISDVGDGEELSPLLKTIEKVSEAVSNLNMKFNMNIDVGSNNEMERELQKKASNALLAYENLREHLFRTYRGDNYTSELLYKFDPSQFDTTIGKIEGYKKFIENLRASIKENYGHDKLYEDSDKSYWNKASAAYGQITKVRNAMKADSEGSPLDNLFGSKTDLTEVIEQLKLIVTELGNVSAAAAEIKTVLGNGIQINDSLQQIEALTQKVKELETELTSLKSGTSLPSSETNISSESTSMEQVQKSTDQAVQAKEDFAKANAGVQTSVNESKSPLQLEAELMDKIAESARKAADAKKEFVKANGKVAASAKDSVPEIKAEKDAFEEILPSNFKDVLNGLNLTKSELGEIVKITKQAHANAKGKFSESYILKDKYGSTETYGKSSKTDKGQLLSYNYVEYDANAITKEKKQQLEVEKQLASEVEKQTAAQQKQWNVFLQEEENYKKSINDVNTAISQTDDLLAKLPVPTELEATYSKLIDDVDVLNEKLKNHEIEKPEYNKQVKGLVSDYSTKNDIQQKRDVEGYKQFNSDWDEAIEINKALDQTKTKLFEMAEGDKALQNSLNSSEWIGKFGSLGSSISEMNEQLKNGELSAKEYSSAVDKLISDAENRVKALKEEGNAADEAVRKVKENALNSDWDAAIKENKKYDADQNKAYKVNDTLNKVNALPKYEELSSELDNVKDKTKSYNEQLMAGTLSVESYDQFVKDLITDYKELVKIKEQITKIDLDEKASADKKLEQEKQVALKWTKSQSQRLSDAISKYSYGDTTDAKAMMQQMNNGLLNFGDFSNIQGNMLNLQKTIDQIISSLKKAHDENLAAINAEVKAEENEAKTVWNEKLKAIREYINAVEKLNELVAQDKGTSKNASAIEKQQEKVERLKNNAFEAKDAMDKLVDSKAAPADSLVQWVNTTERLEQASKDASSAMQEAQKSIQAAQASEIKSMNDGLAEYEAKMRSFNSRKPEDRSSDYSIALKDYMDALERYRNELQKIQGHPELINETEINNLKNMRNELDKAATSLKGIDKGSTAISRDKLINKISDYMKKNSAMSKEFKSELEGLIQKLKVLGANADVTNIADEFFKVSQRIREAGQEGKKFWDIVKEKAWYGLAGTIGTYFGLNDLIQYGKQAAQTVINLDTALVDLKKTTTMSSSQLKEFYFDANDVAKQMGVSTQQIIEQASAWSRLGFSTQQASTEMAKLSSQFASISPGMSTDNAQQGLVSIMKAWSIPVEDVKEEIMSNINQLGNTMAESNQDIVDGMERSAAALAAVGTSYKDAFALFSGMQEVLQSSEKAGTSLRSVALRLRSFDESTGEYSEDLQNITGKLIDLTKTAQHAQGVSVFKPGSTTEFKSLVDYFREIHDIWDEMSQKQQNDFLLQAFGRTQAQGGASLIKNFSAVEKALQEMEQSAGSSDREMQVVESSLEYKLNRLKETWVGTAQEIIDRGDLGIAIDGITKVSEALGFLIEKIGLVKIAGVGFLGFLGRDKLKQQFCPV